MAVFITADGETRSVMLPPELTVRAALAHTGLSLSELDRLAPPPYTLISDGLAITVTRVTESYEADEAVLPFSSQVVKNEGLPEGERRLLQAGANGIEEITYRTVFEDGIQVSRSILKRLMVAAPVPEVIMVGSQGAFTIVPISGTLAYLNGQNAWIMRKNSAQRFPLVATGDLDGQVFELSPDGQWLLYTRAVTQADSPNFNTLWAIPTTAVTTTRPVSLPVRNVLYAEWSPARPRTFAYSTAERIARAPGWQANNDLWLTNWSEKRNGQTVFTTTQLLDSSSGGIYGWWGTGFAFAPDGASIAYARTDSVGLVHMEANPKTLTVTVRLGELAQFTAFNTHSDWAWYPTLHWAPDGLFLYTVTHGPPIGLEAADDSPVFDLTALSVSEGLQFKLIPRAGMFANPVPSPIQPTQTAEEEFRVAFMQAADSNNSPFSTYRLGVMDRDGSNVYFIFPPDDRPGLSANQTAAWSPDGRLLAVIYDGNLWLIDPDTGLTQQLTGDGLSEQPRWGR